MSEQIEARLAELKKEFQAGADQLRELVQREAALREKLLRISGAIQVLEELRGRSREGDGRGSITDPAGHHGADVLTVG